VGLLQTFIYGRIQPLWPWDITMLMNPGSSYPDRSFFAELDDVEINARIRGILIYGANQNSGPSPIPLRGGAISPWVSLLKLIFIGLCQFLLP
jgi:hypothetical protein